MFSIITKTLSYVYWMCVFAVLCYCTIFYKDGWKLAQKWFLFMKEFRFGLLTASPRISSVESDFAVARRDRTVAEYHLQNVCWKTLSTSSDSNKYVPLIFINKAVKSSLRILASLYRFYKLTVFKIFDEPQLAYSRNMRCLLHLK